jgi:4-amino-4-deoxy-L-arabinose transferase-like glycosyltransferase
VDDRFRLLGAVALAMLVRVVVIALTGGGNGVEVFEYDQIARNLLDGRGYVYTHLGTEYRAFYSGVPYVALLAAGYALSGGGVLAALALQTAASAALTAVAFVIGKRLGGEGTACLAAVLVALHPGLAFYDTHKIHPLSVDALAIAVAALMLLRLRDTLSTGAALLAGLTFGVAVLQRGTMILVPFAAVLWLASVEPRSRARLVRLGVAYAVGAVLVVTPWVVRNWVVLGTPILSSVGAESLWRGNAPHSLGGSYVAPGQTVLQAAPVLRESLRGRTELEQSAIFQAAAEADAAGNPAGFAMRIVRKLVIFWSFGPVSGVQYPSAYIYIYAAYYVGLVALAVVGAWRIASARRGDPMAFPTLLLIALVALGVAVVQSVFYVELRHRWGVEAFLLTVAAAGMAHLWSAVRGTVPTMAEVSR